MFKLNKFTESPQFYLVQKGTLLVLSDDQSIMAADHDDGLTGLKQKSTSLDSIRSIKSKSS